MQNPGIYRKNGLGLDGRGFVRGGGMIGVIGAASIMLATFGVTAIGLAFLHYRLSSKDRSADHW